MFLVQATEQLLENAFSFTYVHVAHERTSSNEPARSAARAGVVAEPITENMRAANGEVDERMPLITGADIAAAENGPVPMLDLSREAVGLNAGDAEHPPFCSTRATRPRPSPRRRRAVAAAPPARFLEVGLWMAPGHGGTPKFCFVEYAVER